MSGKWNRPIFLVIAVFFGGLLTHRYIDDLQKYLVWDSGGGLQISTEEYIKNFDLEVYERIGADYFNSRYSPLRLNKPLNNIDRLFDYDFSRLKSVEERIANVDRRQALSAIFYKITAGAVNDTERHLALLRFLHKSVYHNTWIQPMHEDKSWVLDPLVLLELGEMQCGAVSRLAADLFDSVGYPSRIVQLAGHQVAEVYYDGSWHLFDADLFGGGYSVMVDGLIPAVADLAATPLLIDRIPAHLEAFVSPRHPDEVGSPDSLTYPSYFYFSAHAYGNNRPLYLMKNAGERAIAGDRYYGWGGEHVDGHTWRLTDLPRRFEPAPPVLVDVEIYERHAVIKWQPAPDYDNDLLGYRIFISTTSRGWQHGQFSGADRVRQHFHGSWQPEMYDAMFRLPPSDIALITTSGTSVELDLPPNERRYITVMPFDQHGLSVGRTLFNMSEELMLAQSADGASSTVSSGPQP